MRRGQGIVHPVLDAQSGDAPEFLRIVGHPRGAKVPEILVLPVESWRG
ncbi:hypothetical protein X805_34080 [Sphaerotilus natans subsp. natans DSM 6575]|uniref:Uncharacterized protein n=1 Tax=Sphaerotilus natans subsp. natans DSM 6575 TaxID=1286631 RepID=A0A059KIF9_9BURK|nr:hypothetical protein [Sphaerotilus natans]KDB50989.1 hypothetical protein X805_34080 [Sphaerotilus natans subsp. natans DSM 6575]